MVSTVAYTSLMDAVFTSNNTDADYNISMETCYANLRKGPEPLTAVKLTNTANKCIESVSILSTLIVILGLLANLFNIAVFTAGIKYSPRTRFLLAVSVCDLILLIFQLPQLIITAQDGQISASHRSSYGGYAILSYCLNFMLLTCSIWLLVAMVIHHWLQSSSDNEMTDVLSNEVNAENTDKFTSKEFQTCNIAVAAVTVICFGLHIVKVFEFNVNSDLLIPSLLVKRQSLQTKSYEIYNILINIFVSYLIPFCFFLGTLVYNIYQTIKLRGSGKSQTGGQKLIFAICVFFVTAHVFGLYSRVLPLVNKSYFPKTSCVDKVGEMFMLTFVSGKVIIYVVFYEVYVYFMKRRLGRVGSADFSYKNRVNNFSMSKQSSATAGIDTSFENPIYGQLSEDINDDTEQSKM